MELKPCPFCGSDKVDTAGSAYYGDWYVLCPACGAAGPAERTEEESKVGWNRRKRRKVGKQNG
jgi:Lar family restriction alleviation protein